jgi:transcriptional regulator with XRE-family HTH domain
MMSDEQLKALRKPKSAVQEELASAAQMNYIKILIEDRLVPEPWLLRIKELVEAGLTKPKASQIIGHLKNLPRSPLALDNREGSPNKVTSETLPSGRYAIEIEDSKNDIAFYKVKWNDKGDFYYLDQIVGPNMVEVKFQMKQAIVKQIIRQGVGNCAARYGFKIKRCSICHTRITNRLSRELGLGPICGGRVYSDWQNRVDIARQSLLDRGLDPNENVDD